MGWFDIFLSYQLRGAALFPVQRLRVVFIPDITDTCLLSAWVGGKKIAVSDNYQIGMEGR